MFDSILLILFVCFVVALILLDIAMVISLVRSGDERRQLMIWKASTFTLIGTVCVMFIDPSTISKPFSQLGATAIIYFCSLLYYKRKLGG